MNSEEKKRIAAKMILSIKNEKIETDTDLLSILEVAYFCTNKLLVTQKEYPKEIYSEYTKGRLKNLRKNILAMINEEFKTNRGE